MLAEAILVHGDIGYKFRGLLPSKDQNQGTSLSYLVFVIDPTRSNQLWQLTLIFGVDCICMINHIVILFSFHHSRHLYDLIGYTYTIRNDVVLSGI